MHALWALSVVFAVTAGLRGSAVFRLWEPLLGDDNGEGLVDNTGSEVDNATNITQSQAETDGSIVLTPDEGKRRYLDIFEQALDTHIEKYADLYALAGGGAVGEEFDFRPFREWLKMPQGSFKCDYILTSGVSQKALKGSPFKTLIRHKQEFAASQPRHCFFVQTSLGTDKTVDGLAGYWPRARSNVLLMALVVKKIIVPITLEEPWMHATDADHFYTHKYHGVDWLLRKVRRMVETPDATTLEEDFPDKVSPAVNVRPSDRPWKLSDFTWFMAVDGWCQDRFQLNVGSLLIRPSAFSAFVIDTSLDLWKEGWVFQFPYDIAEQSALGWLLKYGAGYDPDNLRSMCQLNNIVERVAPARAGEKLVLTRFWDFELAKKKKEMVGLVQRWYGDHQPTYDQAPLGFALIHSSLLNAFVGGMARYDTRSAPWAYQCGDAGAHLVAIPKEFWEDVEWRANMFSNGTCRNVLPFQSNKDGSPFSWEAFAKGK